MRKVGAELGSLGIATTNTNATTTTTDAEGNIITVPAPAANSMDPITHVAALIDEIVEEWKDYSITLELRLEVKCDLENFLLYC